LNSSEPNLQQLEILLKEDIKNGEISKLYRYNKLMAYYRCAIMEIETKFNVLNEEFSLRFDRNPINGMKSRLKSLPSIKAKLEKMNLHYDVNSIEENLNDVAGIRVICSFTEDVYTLADALLKQDDIQLIAKKDYIKNPKPNGYRSLHLIVGVPIFLAKEKRIMKAEIQLRTIAMDFLAKELKFCAELSAELDGRMDALRSITFESGTDN